MTFFIYFNLLLRFLILSFGLVLAKRTAEDMSTDDEPLEDSSENDIKDMVDTKKSIENLIDKGVIDRLERKNPVSVKDFNDFSRIKEEYSSFFEEEEGEQPNSIKEALKEITDYLDEEIKALDKGSSTEDNEASSSEDNNKRSKPNDMSDGREVTDYPTEMPPFWDDGD